ncbi:hypothetical protein BGZ83_004764 [Gryganskiella cystojenkinii]|nr:hypothetical protein BGZ83_004764 [Gryganskiella cystojenkinii]
MPFANVLCNPQFWKTFFEEQKYSYDQIPDLTGKVAIVTGATGGLGYSTTVALAAHGAHVFLACRNRVKAEEAIERAQADILQLQFDHPDAIHTVHFDDGEDEKVKISGTSKKNLSSGPLSGDRKPRLEILDLDLADLKSCRSAAETFLAKGLPLHILVNNAGIKNRDFDLTEDGFETHFGINHLGHFAFTTALLERVRESAPARIVVLSSMAHEMPPSNKAIDFESIRPTAEGQQRASKMNKLQRYGQSKLANVLFGKALARRLRNDQVWVNIAHPGCTDDQIKKGMLESDSRAFHNFSKVWLALSYPVKVAALTQLYLATSPEVQRLDHRGKYFIPVANEMRPNPISESVDLQEELWAFSERAARGDTKM